MTVLTYGTYIESQTKPFTNTDRSLPTKANLEDFWKLETIGINDSGILRFTNISMTHYSTKMGGTMPAGLGNTNILLCQKIES